MKVHPEKYTVVASSGTVGKTIFASNKMLKNIFVTSSTSTTTFDISITDIYGHQVLLRENLTGSLSEQLELIGVSNWTLTVLNSSVDESFNILLLFLD